MERKRRKDVPPTTTQVQLPKSRCSGNKFITIIQRLSNEKIMAITELGFGGLTQLACRELRYELCNWIISNYDLGYHRVTLATHIAVPVTPEDVSTILGIPSSGVDVVVHHRRATSSRTYNLKLLEENLQNLPIGDDFNKTFIIFACATILAPNSKLEGMHDLWDAIWDGDVGVKKNWAKFVLDYLEDGIRDFRTSRSTYLRGCIMFLQLFYLAKFYMPSIKVELTLPLCAGWTDELIRRRLAAEIVTYGAYGHVDVIKQNDLPRESQVHPQASTSSHTNDSTEEIEARVLETSKQLSAFASSSSKQLLAFHSSLERDIAILHSRRSGVHGSCAHPPTHMSPQIRGENDAVETDDDPSSPQFFEPPAGAFSTSSPIQSHDAYPAHASQTHAHSPHYENSKAEEDVQFGGEPPAGALTTLSPIQSHHASPHHAYPAHASQTHAHSPHHQNSKAEEDMQFRGEGDMKTQLPSIHTYKRTAKRLVKQPAICKSPFVAQCLKQFPKLAHEERVVADLALADGDPNDILCDMHGMYITRGEMSSLSGTRWVNSVIISIVCRMLNAEQSRPPRYHYFDPSFSVVLSNLPLRAKKKEILSRCHAYLDPAFIGYDLSSCDQLFFPVCEHNHWHVHVINIAAMRVEILSSLPLTRGKNISAASRRLSNAINLAFHAHDIHMHMEVSKFEHVQPDIVQQNNGC